MNYFPEIVQVVPHNDYTVSVYFSDGKIVLYNVKPLLGKEVFSKIKRYQYLHGKMYYFE